MNILTNLVDEIRIESAWLPPVSIRQPFADSPPSPAESALGAFFKPAVTVTLAGGGTVTSAPYGRPGASNWPAVQAALIFAGILAAGALLMKRF